MSELKITKMGYSRVFSLGNYENEKISVEADVPEGYEINKAYVELKETVENAHNIRQAIKEYNKAKMVLREKQMYRICDIDKAALTIQQFETTYPNLVEVASKALVENIEDVTHQMTY